MKPVQVRIIGGLWRGRKLPLPDDAVRPTPDRVRETLFNWLMHDIHGAVCLDAFAGTGALGFEALSRGAAQVTFCDKNLKVTEQLKANAIKLGCTEQAVIITSDFLLKNFNESFDIIFLDPPFRQKLVPTCLAQAKKLCKPGGLIYLETESEFDLATDFEILKSQQAGQVKYYLLRNLL